MLIAANFKSYKTRTETKIYLNQLEQFLAKKSYKHEVLVFLPNTALDHYKFSKIGTQNAYPSFEGAFTGEITLRQLEEFHINNILIGHSERRHLLKESVELIINKFEFFAQVDFQIIYCIGEPIKVKQQSFKKILKYLDEQLKDIDLSYAKLIIAYEPVWAIGTGQVPQVDDIYKIFSTLKAKYPIKSLLYGGSVNDANILSLMEINLLDGFLIGSASLDINQFSNILTKIIDK